MHFFGHNLFEDFPVMLYTTHNSHCYHGNRNRLHIEEFYRARERRND